MLVEGAARTRAGTPRGHQPRDNALLDPQIVDANITNHFSMSSSGCPVRRILAEIHMPLEVVAFWLARERYAFPASRTACGASLTSPSSGCWLMWLITSSNILGGHPAVSVDVDVAQVQIVGVTFADAQGNGGQNNGRQAARLGTAIRPLRKSGRAGVADRGELRLERQGDSGQGNFGQGNFFVIQTELADRKKLAKRPAISPVTRRCTIYQLRSC